MSTADDRHTHRLCQTATGPALECIDHPMPVCPLAGWWRDVGWENLTEDDFTEMPDGTPLGAIWTDEGPIIRALGGGR